MIDEWRDAKWTGDISALGRLGIARLVVIIPYG